jgi:hypothetical protein
MRGGRSATMRRVEHERGSVLVEAAILLPVLLMACIGIVEFGRFFYTKIAVENATREAARFAVTGNKLADPQNEANDLSRPAAIKQYLVQSAPTLQMDKAAITIDPPGGGGPGDIVTITVEYRFEFATPLIGQFFPDNAYVIQYTTVMKNEPVFTEKRRT